jgi:hypothetical protein
VYGLPAEPKPASHIGSTGARPPVVGGSHMYRYGDGEIESPELAFGDPPSCSGAMIPTKKLSPPTPPLACGAGP